MSDESPRRSDRNQGRLRSTVIVLVLVAASIYFGFIIRAMLQ